MVQKYLFIVAITIKFATRIVMVMTREKPKVNLLLALKTASIGGFFTPSSGNIVADQLNIF